MPFTPAHAVVALPFARTPLLPAAIAVGAMTPDLPLFVRGIGLSYQATHTNLALSVVLALGLLALWYLVLRPAVRELSPLPIARRIPPAWDASGRSLWSALRAPRAGARSRVWGLPVVWTISLVLSLLLGVLSHIAWDAFTHEGRWGLSLIPALGADWGPLPGYKWMQYGSSVGGVLLLLVCGAVWLSRRSAGGAERILPGTVRMIWWLSLPVFLIAAWVWGVVVYGPLSAEWTLQHLAYRVLPPACAAWAFATLLLCLWIVALRHRRPVVAAEGVSALM